MELYLGQELEPALQEQEQGPALAFQRMEPPLAPITQQPDQVVSLCAKDNKNHITVNYHFHNLRVQLSIAGSGGRLEDTRGTPTPASEGICAVLEQTHTINMQTRFIWLFKFILLIIPDITWSASF